MKEEKYDFWKSKKIIDRHYTVIKNGLVHQQSLKIKIYMDFFLKLGGMPPRPTKSTLPWDRRSQKNIDPAENIQN